MTVGIDTYITAAEADAIISSMLFSSDTQRTAWEDLSQSDKEAYLMQAMLRIEAQVFSGSKTDIDQPLQFPRYDDTEVPNAVKQAQALEACASIGVTGQAAKRAQLRALGIKSFGAGKLSESYGNVSDSALFSLYAKQLLRHYIAGGVSFELD